MGARPEIKLVVVTPKAGVTQADLINRLGSYNDTAFAVPDLRGRLQVVPNDTHYGNQWGPKRIGAEAAWNITRGNANGKVAIIDTGVDCLHEDFAGDGQLSSTLVGICEPISSGIGSIGAGIVDASGHGTMIAGIIGSRMNNTKGVAGLSQGPIVSVSVAEPTAVVTGSFVLLAEAAIGVVLATQAGAKIISISFGFDCVLNYCSPMDNALAYADSKGVLLVAAAGNSNCGPVEYPASHALVLGVGSIKQGDQKSAHIACGDGLDLVAPGEGIFSTISRVNLGICAGQGIVPTGPYCYSTGTSFAAPHVAGSAALVWSACPTLSRDTVRDLLLDKAQVLPLLGSNEQGRGLVRVDSALNEARMAYPSQCI